MSRCCLSPAEGDSLGDRVKRLGLYGVLLHWEEYAEAPWLPALIEREEAERGRRSLERRIRNARLGRFKPMADFDWSWPEEADREQVEDLFSLEFMEEAGNVVLVGPNGVGKTMIAQNIAHHALMRGYTVRFATASEMLTDLTAQESGAALSRRLRHFCQPSCLVVDEVGYLSYGSRHADLLFEVVARRHKEKSTVITTNRAFSEWNEVFPNATCVVALVDRLIHRAEIVRIEGESYRLKEAKEREAQRAKARASRKKRKGKGSGAGKKKR